MLTRTIYLLAVLSALQLSFSPAVQAMDQDGLGLSIGADLQHFDYREYSDQGRLLDQETGFLPGVQFGIDHKQDAWLIAAKLFYYAGNVGYTGQTNGGVPITTTTRQRMTDVELLAGYQFQQMSRLTPTLYLGATNHRWRRDIQPTYTAYGMPVRGLLETYRWWQAFLGARISLYEARSFNWELDARATRMVAPQIEVDYSGLYDNARLNLGERWGFRLKAPLSFAVHDSTTMVIEPYWDRFTLGRSQTTPLTRQGVVIGTVFEPDSTTSNYGVSLYIRQLF